jgi:hypothetical protein
VIEDETTRRQVVGKGIVDHIAGPETGCEQGAGPAPGIGLAAHRLEDRPRRHEHPSHVPDLADLEAAKRRFTGL